MKQFGGTVPRGIAGPTSIRRKRLRKFIGRAAIALGLLVPIAGWAECQLKSLELPVTMVGMRPIATVNINGTDVKLLVDSGAFFSFLTEPAAAQLGLEVTRAPAALDVQGFAGPVDARRTRVKQLKLGSHEVKDVDFIVGGNEPGSGAMGLIGRNLLAGTDIEYDLGNGMIRYIQPEGDCARQNLAYWAGSSPVSVILLKYSSRSKVVSIEATATLNGKEMRVLFDTGAESVVSLEAAKRAGISGDDMTPAERVYGLGKGDLPAWTAPFKTFEMGAERILNNRFEIADFNVDKVDMIAGIDFFLSHHIYVARSQGLLYFTYSGGPVFALNTAPSAQAADAASVATSAEKDPDQPADAAGYARRGAARTSRGDYARAVAELDRACTLDPKVASCFTSRGIAFEGLKQPDKALKDFDEALRLDPAESDARFQRADLREQTHDPVGAADDLRALDAALAPQAHMRQDMARLYQQLELPDKALAQWDLWIAAHPTEPTLPKALNARCRARATLNVELDKALVDCNAAIDHQPKTATYLDSRAWVYLRQGRYREASEDYDRALKIDPLFAWSLYGRGIARIRLGDQERGMADIAAARKARPSIDQDAGRYGLALQ